ncbi:hypothetical protein IMSHALPRED_002100 [Imshaugia aleurites]|uniref:Uncharacterized protein n=1 Tax=Imshaugia aleurites TaxID=172621 RepID=A0A8H3J4P4_9LECA|nr:hypothetical protein IMSHALPRED_002100 [Imshaugia aleurites]
MAVFIKKRYSLVYFPIPSGPGPVVAGNDANITPQVLNVTSIPTLGLPTVSGGLPNPSYWTSLPPGNGAAYENIVYSNNLTTTIGPTTTTPPVHHPMVTTFVTSIATTLSPDCTFTSAVTEIYVGDTTPDLATLPWCACSPNDDPAEGVGGYWAQATDTHCTRATQEVPQLFTKTTEVETITSTISS